LDVERREKECFNRSVKAVPGFGAAIFLERLQPFFEVFAGIFKDIVYGVLGLRNFGCTGISIRCRTGDLTGDNEI
jgi:hypothetical protein